MTELDMLKRISDRIQRAFSGQSFIVRGRNAWRSRGTRRDARGRRHLTDAAGCLSVGFEPDDIRAVLLYARRMVSEERIEPLMMEAV